MYCFLIYLELSFNHVPFLSFLRFIVGRLWSWVRSYYLPSKRPQASRGLCSTSRGRTRSLARSLSDALVSPSHPPLAALEPAMGFSYSKESFALTKDATLVTFFHVCVWVLARPRSRNRPALVWRTKSFAGKGCQILRYILLSRLKAQTQTSSSVSRLAFRGPRNAILLY